MEKTRQTLWPVLREGVRGCLLHEVVSQANNAGSHDCESAQHLAPVGVVQSGLADAQGDEIVDKAATEDPVAACSETSKSGTGNSLDGGARQSVLVVCNTHVVEEVKNTNAGECLSVDVRENGGKTLSVHGAEFGEDEIKLTERVDDHKYV